MTATIDDVAKKKPAEVTAEQQAAAELVRMAKEQGLSLTGPDGLLKQLTKSVIETALDEAPTPPTPCRSPSRWRPAAVVAAVTATAEPPWDTCRPTHQRGT